MSYHDEVQEKAERRAGIDYKEFIEDCDWAELLEKYADFSNRYNKAMEELNDKHDRGTLRDLDFVDVYYYRFYRELLAGQIAYHTLKSEDYERDRRGYWILKTKPKKKFGFWG